MPVPAPPNGVNGHHDDEDELDIDYSEIEERYAVSPNEGFDNVLVIDNIPLVDEARKQKLLDRLRQAFAKAGAPLEGEQREDGTYEDMFMPWDDETDQNKGFIFVTYPSAPHATNALRALDQTLFGKNRLHVNRFGDIEKYASMPIEEGEVPKGWVDDVEGAEREHLKSWLADPQGRDQFVTFRDQYVDICWMGRGGNAEPAVKSEPRWGELFVSWSPLGTYFTTLHRIGVALWSGASFKTNKFQRFTHPGVRLIDFSPCEQYLVTFSADPIVPEPLPEDAPPNPRMFGPEDEGNQIAVWEIKTGLLLRTFPGEAPPPPPPAGTKPEDMPPPRRMAWPLLRWSPDDKYVARCNMGTSISVYETPSMGMLDKKSVKIDGVLDFGWCPDKELGESGKENVIAYWQPEVENQPAKISLMGIPSRNILRSKNIFNVSDCKLYWQDQGHYLCVKVDRFTKTKKNIYSNLELFRVKEKNYPVEVVELKDVCTQFQWEPSGSRFAAVTTNDANLGNVAPGVLLKNNVEFYYLDQKKGDFRLMRRLENKTINTIAWSPRGRFIVMATVGSSAKSDIEFWDVDFTLDDTIKTQAEPGSNMQLLATVDHYGVTEISWDPSGRYLASSASAWRNSPEPGFCLWDFRGQELKKSPLEKFKQFLWRPRPSTLLSKDDIKKVRKNLREYSKQFDEEDAAEESNVSAELLAHRKRLIDEWNAWRAKRIKELAVAREKAGLVSKKPKQEEVEQVEEWIEDVIDETEEVVVE